MIYYNRLDTRRWTCGAGHPPMRQTTKPNLRTSTESVLTLSCFGRDTSVSRCSGPFGLAPEPTRLGSPPWARPAQGGSIEEVTGRAAFLNLPRDFCLPVVPDTCHPTHQKDICRVIDKSYTDTLFLASVQIRSSA